MSYDWKIKEDKKNKTVTVTLEVELQEYRINKSVSAPIKVNTSQVVRYLQKQGIEVGRTIKNNTVTNRSEQNRRGTWIFELKTEPQRKPKQRKRATSRRKKAPPPPPSGTLTDN